MPEANQQNDHEKYAELIERAELLLGQRWAAPVRLGDVKQISEPRRRNLLLRCTVQDGPADAPKSIILKRARQRRYDPDDPKSRPAVGLFRDWAGLEFLSSLGSHQLASPKFYGGDRAAGFFLMEDLGGSQDLDHMLTRGSATQARHALLLLAGALGRMHAQTVGRAEQYQQIRDALGPGDQLHRERLAQHARDYAPILAEQCNMLGINVEPDFLEDVEMVALSMADPGDFLAYTHADVCPDNCVLAGDRICLIDYEFGSFRHALLDGVYGWIRFPTCWCVRDIPDAVVAEMETVYRAELVKGCPAARDDQRYFCAVADACAYWLLENLAQLFERALQYEEPKGTSTNRQRLLMRLAAFQQVARRAGHLEGLRRTLQSLLDELRGRWRDNTLLYDAFGVPCELADDDVRQIVAAAGHGQIERVAELLHKNPALSHAKDDDADQTPLLYLAVETKKAELITLLLENGADWRAPTRTGWTVLARACSQATPEIVDLLIDAGANINERDMWGTLPLYGALGNRDMLTHLLKRGAKADLKCAIDMDGLDVAERILEAAPDQARMRFGTGLTLLHDSARAGDARVKAMDLLVQYGADVDAVTNWEATPLHLAAFHGNVRSVEFLIDRGAALDIKDDYGLTPLGVAEAKGHATCAELLRSRMPAADRDAAHATMGYHSVDAGAGVDLTLPTTATATTNHDAGMGELDAFYRALGHTLASTPHPLDEFARDLALERLDRRRRGRQNKPPQ